MVYKFFFNGYFDEIKHIYKALLTRQSMEKKNSNKIALKRVLIFTISVSVIVAILINLVQYYGASKITQNCSYLDPITIDLLAFVAGIFLVVEGYYKIIIDNNRTIKNNLTRVIRITAGTTIFILHIVQFIHK